MCWRNTNVAQPLRAHDVVARKEKKQQVASESAL